MINSSNEWGELKEVILGTATNAHWPRRCPVFRNLENTTLWTDSPVPSGKVSKQIIDETNDDLEHFKSVLEGLKIKVHRPNDLNFDSFDGMYNYCPRDRVLIIGNKAIDAPMLYPTRTKEISAIEHLFEEFIKCDDEKCIFDAANICRLGNDILYLVSDSGNVEGGKWLQSVLPDHNVYILDNVYKGVHIDSTIIPLREGLVMLNNDRINSHNLPKIFKTWDKIWITKSQIVEQSFTDYPYASLYIALNLLSINDNLVICDPKQYTIRKELEKYGIESIGVDLRHSRTLGGGHHCTTLDLIRE